MLYIINNVEKLPDLSENAFNTALRFSWKNICKFFIKTLIYLQRQEQYDI